MIAYNTAGAIWTVLGWCMLAGLVLTVVTTFQEKQKSEADSSTSARCCHMSNVLFYGAVLLTLAFLPKLVRGPLGSTPERRNFLGCLVHHRHRGAGPLRGRGPPSLAHRLGLALQNNQKRRGRRYFTTTLTTQGGRYTNTFEARWYRLQL